MTHVSAGFARQNDSMDQLRHLLQDMTDKQRNIFQWLGQMARKAFQEKNVQNIIHQHAGNANNVYCILFYDLIPKGR